MPPTCSLLPQPVRNAVADVPETDIGGLVNKKQTIDLIH